MEAGRDPVGFPSAMATSSCSGRVELAARRPNATGSSMWGPARSPGELGAPCGGPQENLGELVVGAHKEPRGVRCGGPQGAPGSSLWGPQGAQANSFCPPQIPP